VPRAPVHVKTALERGEAMADVYVLVSELVCAGIDAAVLAELLVDGRAPPLTTSSSNICHA